MKNGYTLIELLVVISIMGIIFSTGYVGFREFSRRQALVALARNVRADLRLAQQKALSGEKTGACAILAGYDFRVDSSTAYSINANCSNGNFSAKNVSLGNDFMISATNNPVVLFKVLGQGAQVSAGSSLITLTQSATGKTTTIAVTSGGEIFLGASTPLPTSTPTVIPTTTPTPTPALTPTPTTTPTPTPTGTSCTLTTSPASPIILSAGQSILVTVTASQPITAVFFSSMYPDYYSVAPGYDYDSPYEFTITALSKLGTRTGSVNALLPNGLWCITKTVTITVQ